MSERDDDDRAGLDRQSRSDASDGRSIWEQAASEEAEEEVLTETDQSGAQGTDAAGDGREGYGREGYDRRPGGSPGHGTSRPATDRRQSRPRQPGQGADMLSDFQRWLLRSSAKNMRREITGQVRKTLGGGRSDRADVWDTATTEIPPEVGESPECQWCPICRAARRMRESGPDLSDHLSAAGDAVAGAVQEAMRAFDTILTRGTDAADQQAPRRDASAGRKGPAAGRDEAGDSEAPPADRDEWIAARDAWAAAHGGQVAPPSADPDAAGPGPGGELTSEPDRVDEPDDRG